MWDSVWETVFSNQAWGKYPAEELIRFVARNYYKTDNRSGVRFLEIGCGPGANLWYLAREGFGFSGIDGSASAIQQAEERLDEECSGWRDRGELYQGDFSQLPFPDSSFDAVIDNEAVYCNDFDASVGIYAEARRVLKPGGRIYSRTFASGSWGDGTGEKVGHNAWRCAYGPLAGKGASRFTALEEVPTLLAGFSDLSSELLSWTLNERQNVIKEWIVTGIKPDDRHE